MSAIATIAFMIVLLITHNVFAKIYQRLKVWGDTYIHPVPLGNWKLIRSNQLENLLTWLLWLAQAMIILGRLAAYFPLCC